MFGYVLEMHFFDYKVCWFAYEVVFSLRDLLRTDILISATTSYKKSGVAIPNLKKQFNHIKKDIHFQINKN